MLFRETVSIAENSDINEYLRNMLDVQNVSDAKILGAYVARAITAIKNYLNNPKFDLEFVEANFEIAIVALTIDAYNRRNKEHIKSETQGKRSVSYASKSDFFINDEIASLLPVPFARLY